MKQSYRKHTYKWLALASLAIIPMSVVGCSSASHLPPATITNQTGNSIAESAQANGPGNTSNNQSNPANDSSNGGNLTTSNSAAANSTVTGSSESQSKSIASKITITAKHVKTTQYDITYAQLSGLPSTAVENKLNEALHVQPQTLQLMGKSDSYSLDYRLMYQAGNLLEIEYDSYDYPQGAAHGMPIKQVFLMNIETGQLYSMKSLFRTGSNYLQTLSNLVKQKDTMHVLSPKFTGVTSKDGFILTRTGIQIFFTPYEWASFADGFPSFDMSYDELTRVLNTSGSLWKSIQSSQTKADLAVQQADINKIDSLGFHTVVTDQYGRNFDEWFAASNAQNGQTLYAFYATNTTSGTNEGNVFFFLNNRYLGTDTLKPHSSIEQMYPDGAKSITVDYDDYAQNNGASKPFTVRFTWGGSKLETEGNFPKGFGE